MEATNTKAPAHASLEDTQLNSMTSLLAGFSSRSAQDLLALLAGDFEYHSGTTAACGSPPPPPLDKGTYARRAGALFDRFDDLRVTPRVMYRDETHDTVSVYAEMAGLLKEDLAWGDGDRTWDVEWSMIVRLSEDGRRVVGIQNL